jgi:hypothetical protein
MFTYVTYIKVNEALFKCYEGIKPKAYEALSKSDQENVCKTEREAVEAILASGELRFPSIVSERLNAI